VALELEMEEEEEEGRGWCRQDERKACHHLSSEVHAWVFLFLFWFF
jgi:hypothetical protein